MIEHYLPNKNENTTVAQIPKFKELNTRIVSHLLFYISFVLRYSRRPKISNVFYRSSYSNFLCKYYLFCYDLIYH